MANTLASLLSFALCLLLLSHGSSAQEQQGRSPLQSERRFRYRSECRFESLNALEPTRRVESEAGVTEYWDERNQQLECAGVAAHRRIIQPRGLLLPYFSNAPSLVYIVQGRGMTGTMIPGCPETYQSFQQGEPRMQEGQRVRFRDQHQKIHRFRQGDVIALPAGVAHWCYNDGDTPVVAITVLDTSSNANQLDPYYRQFMLAGSQSKGQRRFEHEESRRESSGDNILSGFDVETLSEVFGVSRETARKLQCQDDPRGEMVRLDRGLQVLGPQSMREEEQCEAQEREDSRPNGLGEAICNARIRENINDPSRADFYTPRGGRITSLNSQKLPILRYLRLSAERGVLHRNAFHAPHWNINAHSAVYCTGGRGRLQIVGNQGRTVFDGELRRGQLVVVPQNFAVVKQARNEGFEWVSFKTNDNAMITPIVGKTSAFRGMPVDVIANAYRVSREEAMRLKFNREEVVAFEPRSQRRASA